MAKKRDFSNNDKKREAELTAEQGVKTDLDGGRNGEDIAEASETDVPVSEEASDADALAEARGEAEAYKDRWVRLAAEFENYKKRTAREFEALVQSANGNIIRDLLPILDNVDRALAHGKDGQTDSEGYREGVRMIMDQLPQVLQNRGLVEIEATGQPFDPHFHEALMQIDSDEYDAGAVAEVVEKGYCLGDKVIRHAKVVVSSGPAKEKRTPEPVSEAREEGSRKQKAGRKGR